MTMRHDDGPNRVESTIDRVKPRYRLYRNEQPSIGFHTAVVRVSPASLATPGGGNAVGPHVVCRVATARDPELTPR